MQAVVLNAPSRALDLSKRFQKAKSHSRAVKIYKTLIPMIFIVFSLFLAAFQFLSPIVNKFNASVDGYKINGTRISMLSPNLNGYMKDNKPYRVRAERSEQDMKTPALVDLFTMEGEFTLSDGGTALVKSIEGTMQTDKDIIEFRKNVTLTTTNQQFVSTSEAIVNAKAGTIFAPHKIELRSSSGKMVADSMDFQDGGKVIVFMGNVKGMFVPSSNEGKAE